MPAANRSAPGRPPHRAWLRFHAELNDFLRPELRGRRVPQDFYVAPALKDAIEACGVPHTEVDLIVVNGRAAGFADRLPPGAEVGVYPVCESAEIPALASLDRGRVRRLQPVPPREARFAVDVNLGRLAQLLRLFGFDAVYRNDIDDAELAALAAAGQRILLTRDIGLLMRRQVGPGRFVRATRPEAQLLDVLRHFNLVRQLRPFTRCLRCNGELDPVAADAVADAVPPRVRASVSLFSRCRECGRVYWPGTHYRRMQQFVLAVQAELVGEAQIGGGESGGVPGPGRGDGSGGVGSGDGVGVGSGGVGRPGRPG